MRKLMWFALGCCGACAVATYCNQIISLPVTAILFTLAIVMVVAAYWFRWIRIPAVLLLSFAIGLGWYHAYDAVYLSDARELHGESRELTVELTDFSYATSRGSAATGYVTVNKKPYQVLVYFDEAVTHSPGTKITGYFRFTYTAGVGEQEAMYYRSEGIFLLASLKSESGVKTPENTAFYYYPALWRKAISERLELLFEGENRAFAKALLLGDRTEISYEMNTAFKLSGISHIVAVSGLHVAILFSLVYLLCGRKRVPVFLLGFPVLLIFAAITGFTPSVTRACIMQMLVLLGMLTEREYDPPTALAFAALTMLAVNPMVISSISFQLSVGCMVGIFLFSEPIRQWLEKRMKVKKGKSLITRLKRWFITSVSISLSASTVTTPLVAYHFGAVSLVSVLTNFLVVWFISYIFYVIMLACVLSVLFLPLGKAFAWLVGMGIQYVIGTAKLLSAFPLAAVYTKSIYIVAWLIGVYCLFLVYLCIKKKPVIVFGCVCIISLCAALLASWLEPVTDGCRMTMLDVGQGQCILLQSEGKTFLVDCGGDSDSATADIAAETLLSQGVYRLDGIIVTHYDADHAGGVPYLLTRIPADKVYLPDMVDAYGLGIQIRQAAGDSCVSVDSDIELSFEESKIHLFAPENFELENECSICVLFQTEKCDILITGDRGMFGEHLLTNRVQLPQLDVLVAGHHGSAYSTGDLLLEKTRPEYVLISVGDNRYGHPAKSLLKRLERWGCIVYRTDIFGTIIYRG